MFHNSVLDDRRQNRVTCWVSNDEGTAASAEWELGIYNIFVFIQIAFIKIR